MIFNDVDDWEDQYQFRQLLRHLKIKLGHSIYICEKVRRAKRRKKFRFQGKAKDFYDRVLTVDHNVLVSILYPEDKRLQEISAYHRYVLTLLAYETRTKAAIILNTDRDYLNDWIKDFKYTVIISNYIKTNSTALNDAVGH